MTQTWEEAYKEKVIPPELVAGKAEKLRREGRSIATLNGSFDLLHAGHLHIIFSAAQQADCLLVALNSDESIRQYKGKGRPIVPLEYRLQMMAALSFVNYVTWFDETTPCEILSKIRPNVHVNGAEYGHHPVEADVVSACGGGLCIVDLVPGLSTSSIINKIASLPTKGMAFELMEKELTSKER